MPCRAHLAQLRQRRETLEGEFGARIVVVSFESPAELAAFARREGSDFLFLSDPKRRAYAAFGLAAKPTLWRLFSPATVIEYLRGFLAGRPPRLPRHGTDTHQLGGDVIISQTGEVVFVHRSREPADRPSFAQLEAALRDLKAAQQ
ncbi:MAG TPA: SelL-related redox protein [Dehalococcoidia bacterium]|nr:SelL-related redox protein [Dehalococcoidia bacterium]